MPYAGPSKQPVQTAVRGLSTKRILVGLFLLGPFLVQLLDNAGLLHHPESHITHAMVNLFSAIWAIAVVGIALNGGLTQLHSEAPRGQQGCLVHLYYPLGSNDQLLFIACASNISNSVKAHTYIPSPSETIHYLLPTISSKLGSMWVFEPSDKSNLQGSACKVSF